MAWYTTGTIAVSGTTVTGTGTNWLDSKQSIGPGQALLIPGSGTVKLYEIASVTSATKLTLKTSPGTIAAGQAYAILSFYTDSIPDFARRLAAQLSYYQSQMDGWQDIMTGSGSVTMTAPDGTAVTISSFAKMTTDVNTALNGLANSLKLPTSNFAGDANDIINPGVYSIPSSTANLPVAANGTLLCLTISSGAAVTQEFTSVSTSSATINRKWTRSATVSSGVANWQPWTQTTLRPVEMATGQDLNTLTESGVYYGGGYVNGPSEIVGAYGFIEVSSTGAGTVVKQVMHTSTANNRYLRTCVNGSWSDWAKIYTTNSKPSLTDLSGKLPVANGGTGQTSLNSLLAALGFTANTSTLNVATASGYTYRFVAGSTVVTTNESGESTVSYFNAFNNACLATVILPGDTTGTSMIIINYSTSRTTSFDFRVYNGTARLTNAAVRVNYIAIGY
ncbi:pyocin knob domain-containing protein [Mixta mediterraneensis]|uniref:pyocin knob domain-containing protein n=1 Tax=Mixta mediterraneensis TaxID=2758443 RepID=UPI0018772394|nr:pyocin knob domain-containing protein [Mixta mediterraneensis]MBE5251714.1 hypothetical protein [Mixta mediterraneensis]